MASQAKGLSVITTTLEPELEARLGTLLNPPHSHDPFCAHACVNKGQVSRAIFAIIDALPTNDRPAAVAFIMQVLPYASVLFGKAPQESYPGTDDEMPEAASAEMAQGKAGTGALLVIARLNHERPDILDAAEMILSFVYTMFTHPFARAWSLDWFLGHADIVPYVAALPTVDNARAIPDDEVRRVRRKHVARMGAIDIARREKSYPSQSARASAILQIVTGIDDPAERDIIFAWVLATTDRTGALMQNLGHLFTSVLMSAHEHPSNDVGGQDPSDPAAAADEHAADSTLEPSTACA